MAFDEPPGSAEVTGDDRLVSVIERDELTEAAETRAALAVAPELVAHSLREYVRVWLIRVRGGESGVLPVVGGLILISILFQSLNSHFLTAGNLVNLLVQGSVYMLLAMGEIFALLLGEIDLSIGFVSGIGGIIVAELVKQSYGWPWWAAIIVALVACAAIGILQGTIITRIGLPSFVVTLAGPARLAGGDAADARQGRRLADQQQGHQRPGQRQPDGGGRVDRDACPRGPVRPADLAPGLPPAGQRPGRPPGQPDAAEDRRRPRGRDRRGGHLQHQPGYPHTHSWRPMGCPDRARGARPLDHAARADPVRALHVRHRRQPGRGPAGRCAASPPSGRGAFMLASFTAGIAGIIYASRLRSVSTALDGGTLVLYAVAAAVIGGTSLFGGRGKALHAVLGGLVIAAIDNGMGLQGYSAAAKYVVTAIVLLAGGHHRRPRPSGPGRRKVTAARDRRRLPA